MVKKILELFSRLMVGFVVIFGIAGAVLMISGLAFQGIEALFNDEDEVVSTADGFTIEKYNVVLDVKEDNKVDVTENITLNFTNAYKHGIYKFTPLWLKYTDKNGNTIKRKSNVLNYRAVGDPYSVDTIKRKARIKIGSASEYVRKGEKTYVIKYTYDMGRDPFRGFDEFIFHAFGDYWGTEIKNASIQINMPKSIEGYNVNFFTDKYRQTNVNNVVDYEVKGNTLYAVFNSEKNYQNQLNEYRANQNGQWRLSGDYGFKYYYKSLRKSLTVDIELPEGYFVGGSWNYGIGSFLISIIIFVLTGWTIRRWYYYGKDYEKREKTVEFYPPDNLNAAEIGYIFNNKQANKKLTIALIVQLASKGYIKIDELDDKEKNIQITNLVPILKEPTPIEKTLPKRQIHIQMLKEADSNLSKAEKAMMLYLFKYDKRKTLNSNINKFLAVKDTLVNNGYIEILSDNENTIAQEYEKKKAEYEELMEKYNHELEERNKVTGELKPLSKMETKVYDRLFKDGDVVILSEHKTLYKAFSDVEGELQNSFKDKIHDKHATAQIAGAVFRNIVIVFLSVISYKYVEDLDPTLKIFYTASFACIFVNLFFTIFMKRKTQYGEIITARVKGFRDFLATVEKENLELLVEEDPEYFYNILPYTYVLNISKKWIKKFEDIPMPERDMGTFNYESDFSYYSFYRDIHYPEPVHTSSGGSSGCSSCGGGCSSCGGGCSSCGGGGSW